MAFFRIAKNILNDPPTMGALQRSFSFLEEFHPIKSNTEHPQFKWFRVLGDNIPADHSIEIELLFELISPTRVNISWKLKNQL